MDGSHAKQDRRIPSLKQLYKYCMYIYVNVSVHVNVNKHRWVPLPPKAPRAPPHFAPRYARPGDSTQGLAGRNSTIKLRRVVTWVVFAGPGGVLVLGVSLHVSSGPRLHTPPASSSPCLPRVAQPLARGFSLLIFHPKKTLHLHTLKPEDS